MKHKRKHKRDQDDAAAPPAETDQPQDSRPEAAPSETAEAPPADDLKALQAERDDLMERLQRVSADYLNYQKRIQRESGEQRQLASAELIKALLPVLDDMERALEAARQNHDQDDAFLQGMQLVHDKAFQTLGQFGLEAIDAAGQPFDPDLHSAVMQQPSAAHPPQNVLQEVQKRYRFKGRTLRPSGVIVSTPAGEESQPTED